MDTDKVLGVVTFAGVIAGIGGLVYCSIHAPTPEIDPLSADCEKDRNCTYQVEGTHPGMRSTVFEIDGLRFTIPDEFSGSGRFSPKPAWLGTAVVVHLPNLAPLALEEKNFKFSSDSPNYPKELTISFEKNPRQPRSVHVHELEDKIVAIRSAPRPVPGIPSLQEYAVRGKRSYFRAADNRIRYPDGLPTYFVCYGDSVILGYDFVANTKKARCNMGMTWPNGFQVDIFFSESLLPQWNVILGSAIGLLKRFEDQHRLPSGTLALD